MTGNRLAKSDNPERVIPPQNKDERTRFWVARGNAHLAELGRSDVEWIVTKDGSPLLVWVERQSFARLAA